MGRFKSQHPSPNYSTGGGNINIEPMMPDSAGFGFNTFLIHRWQSMVRTGSNVCLMDVRDYVGNSAGKCQFLHTFEYSIE
jgi:hypothetical protein